MANLSDKLATGAAAPTVLTATNTNIDLTGNTDLNIWVMCDTSSSALSVTLPAGTSGQSVRVIDAGENAGTNIITIVGTIDGATNATVEANSGSLVVAYSGSAWESAGGVDQFFQRDAASGEITSRSPDTLIANTLRTGVFAPSEQSVADTDFTAIGGSVDTTVADEFGNTLSYGADVTTGATPITDVSGNLGGTGGNLVDNNNATNLNSSGACTVRIDFGVQRQIRAINWRPYTGFTPDLNIWVSDTEASGYVQVATIVLSGATPDTFAQYNFTNANNNRYMEIRTSSRLVAWEAEFFEGTSATSGNTFDTNLATGTAGTFAPSSFLAYDQTNTLISGAGKINVAYSIDSGAFTSLVDQGTFQALGNLAYTTSFDVRCQLVGAQRFSRFTLATPSTSTRLTSDGNMQVLESATVVSSIGTKGVSAVSLTTTERDALTGMVAGAMIYNETTNKLNFYNGTSWEAVTSA